MERIAHARALLPQGHERRSVGMPTRRMHRDENGDPKTGNVWTGPGRWTGSRFEDREARWWDGRAGRQAGRQAAPFVHVGRGVCLGGWWVVTFSESRFWGLPLDAVQELVMREAVPRHG